MIKRCVLVLSLLLLVGCGRGSGRVSSTSPPTPHVVTRSAATVAPTAPQGATTGSVGAVLAKNGFYVGDEMAGLREGQGTFTWQNGDTYAGQWRAGLMDGKGTLILKGVGQYTGDFIKGKRSGTRRVHLAGRRLL